MKVGKFIVFTVIAATSGIASFIYFKKKEIDKVIDNLKFKITNVSNIKLSTKVIHAKVFLRIENPSQHNLNVDSGFISLNKIRVYDKSTNRELANSDLKINNIELPAYGFFELPEVEVKIPLFTGAIIAFNQFTKEKKILEQLRFEADIKAMNYTHTINF